MRRTKLPKRCSTAIFRTRLLRNRRFSSLLLSKAPSNVHLRINTSSVAQTASSTDASAALWKLRNATQTTCKGDDKDKCLADRLKGCVCEALETGEQEVELDEPFPQTTSSDTLQKQAEDALGKICGEDKIKMPGYEKEETDPYYVYESVLQRTGERNSAKSSLLMKHQCRSQIATSTKEYCQYEEKKATLCSLKPSATNRCPWSPEETGDMVTFSTPADVQPTPTPTPAPPPLQTSDEPFRYGWCGVLFFSSKCGPSR
jgi:hypothetical protein